MAEASPFPLGLVIAERTFTVYSAEGLPHVVNIALGRPVAATLDGEDEIDRAPSLFRCPAVVTGLGCDERVFAPYGEDPFVALQYAIDLIGDVLEAGIKRMNFRYSHLRYPERPHSWIWRYER